MAPKADLRFAQLATVLSAAVRDGQLEAAVALPVLRHQLRKRNTNKALLAPRRSAEASRSIEKHRGHPPKNGSPEALHCDHVTPLLPRHLAELTSVDEWLAALPDLTEVVCITARENYSLEAVERGGTYGEEKYALAGIELVPSAAV